MLILGGFGLLAAIGRSDPIVMDPAGAMAWDPVYSGVYLGLSFGIPAAGAILIGASGRKVTVKSMVIAGVVILAIIGAILAVPLLLPSEPEPPAETEPPASFTVPPPEPEKSAFQRDYSGQTARPMSRPYPGRLFSAAFLSKASVNWRYPSIILIVVDSIMSAYWPPPKIIEAPL